MSDRRAIAWLLPAGAGLAVASLVGLLLSGGQFGREWRAAARVEAVTEAGVAIAPAVGAATSAVDVASEQRLRGFLQRLQPEAEQAGVSPTTFEAATRRLTSDAEVLALARGQPEFVLAPWEYLARVVTEARIEGGRLNLARHALPFAIIEARSGVDARVLAAIWGIESNYGSAPGERSVLRSLATLAANDARRGAFWKNELVQALLIIEQGDVAADQMVGSWAGAMGHTQFMPSTYSAYAVDFDGDGRRDIWGNALDGVASAANYLRASGWRAGVPWGIEVELPRGFDFQRHPPELKQPLAAWAKSGVKPARAPRLTAMTDEPFALLLPAGARGPAFLVSRNFDAILRYNQSVAYALSVGHLGDRIGGEPAVSWPWPLDDRPLPRAEREEVQARLAMLGFDSGGIDGMVGNRTRGAVRSFQTARGLSADGYVSHRLLEMLRSEPTP